MTFRAGVSALYPASREFSSPRRVGPSVKKKKSFVIFSRHATGESEARPTEEGRGAVARGIVDVVELSGEL